MDLRDFHQGLAARLGSGRRLRPFVCDGNPLTCQAFIVGTNATTDAVWQLYWRSDRGFDKAGWLEQYETGKRLSPTRERIERLIAAAAPVRILETNLYAATTPRAADLPPEQRRTDIFDYLLEQIRPSILLLHGKPARRHFEQATSRKGLGQDFTEVALGGRTVWIAAIPHLFNTSQDQADRIGRMMRALADRASPAPAEPPAT